MSVESVKIAENEGKQATHMNAFIYVRTYVCSMYVYTVVRKFHFLAVHIPNRMFT